MDARRTLIRRSWFVISLALALLTPAIADAAGAVINPSDRNGSRPWKYDVDILQNEVYNAGFPQSFDAFHVDKNGHLWIRVDLRWRDEEYQTSDAYVPRGREATLISKDMGLTWELTEESWPGSPTDRTVFPDGTILETGTRGYLRFPRSEKERLEKEGYLVKDSPHDGFCTIFYNMWMRRSTDGGKTWVKKQIHPQFGFFAYLIHFGQHALLDDGTLIVFCYGQRKVTDLKSTYVIRTKDKGDTWEMIKIADGQLSHTPSGFNECFTVVKSDGHILALLRTRLAHPTYMVRSMDGGLTWSKPQETPIRSKHPLPTLLSDGTIVCTYPRRFRPYGIRARFTSDFGKTWSDEAVLRDDFEIEDGLSWSVTQELPDGTLFTVMNGMKYFGEKTRQGYVYGSRWTRDYRRPLGPDIAKPPRRPVINTD